MERMYRRALVRGRGEITVSRHPKPTPTPEPEPKPKPKFKYEPKPKPKPKHTFSDCMYCMSSSPGVPMTSVIRLSWWM